MLVPLQDIGQEAIVVAQVQAPNPGGLKWPSCSLPVPGVLRPLQQAHCLLDSQGHFCTVQQLIRPYLAA